MTSPLDLGFSVFVKGYKERGQVLMEHLTVEQQAELEILDKYRKDYVTDLREFARRAAEATLRGLEDGTLSVDAAIAISVDTSDLAQRMYDKFMLQLAEILTFGGRQGELPTMESERII